MCQIKECLMLPNVPVIAAVAGMASGLAKEVNDRDRQGCSWHGQLPQLGPFSSVSISGWIDLLIKGPLTPKQESPAQGSAQIQAAPAPQSSAPLKQLRQGS